MQNRTLLVLLMPALHQSAYPWNCRILMRACLTVSAMLQAGSCSCVTRRPSCRLTALSCCALLLQS